MLYDSPVILEYLDHRAGGGKIIPSEPNARFAALTLQALCDGILDAVHPAGLRRPLAPAEMARAEMDRPSGRQGRSARFAVLEAAPPALDAIPNVGADHARLRARLWRSALRGQVAREYPKLVKWLDEFAARVPAFEKTRVTA